MGLNLEELRREAERAIAFSLPWGLGLGVVYTPAPRAKGLAKGNPSCFAFKGSSSGHC